MKVIMIILMLISLSIGNSKEEKVKYNELTEAEKRVIEDKGTEAPFTGEYWDHFKAGVYTCKRCGSALYKSQDKFSSNCGWPSFDDEISGAVKHQMDADGSRTEIICANCGAHLGHVFSGEGYTDKNTRHCVNSISMVFEPVKQQEAAYVAGGCFWGVEYYLEELEGVISAESGYMGGSVDEPDYYQVGSGQTGHAETVRVIFDPEKITYKDIIIKFFEIHDPTQLDKQGPDHGKQYRSAIFYQDEKQRETTQNLINILNNKGYNVVTELAIAGEFWLAENYHQDYYQKKGGQPYCHRPVKRFD
ncbi:MAG: bifunctional methionine sulfoxide reductase B/A protein [Candidatus Stygibacter australis]|nr:bifunctional methionine sulfoxide reductase B/A protein [Candidatus Stygibacter australis]MDP8321790.1 bifunctional methionine sulfoxide reductase B/A protein [Candidatus Stygibacter australis]